MAREVIHHVVIGQPQRVRVEVADEPGPGGAHHRYDLYLFKDRQWQKHSELRFQKGPVKILDDKGKIVREDINGITNEALLAVVIDRLEGFQSDLFRCRENALAITHLQEALHWLQQRTNDRLQRGIEGTTQP